MRWKTFAGRCIHRDMFDAKVHQNMVYRWLTLGSDALQTVINRRHPERSVLQYVQPLIFAAKTCPGDSCLLGLGGAGAAHALAPYLEGFQLDVVEQSLHVIEMAHTYFMTSRIRDLRVIHQEALFFLQHTDSRYQHMMIDLFNAHFFPRHCNSADFFKYCREVLLPGGVLAVNLANVEEQWPIFNLIRVHFQHCTIVMPVKGTANMVVLAYKGSSINPILSVLRQSARLKHLIWDAHWGYLAQINVSS
ncbi:MAG TPA: hypothetical protein DDY37_08400 [Legionella sp.]|nr:hypothetical protein [Legionella sp.]